MSGAQGVRGRREVARRSVGCLGAVTSIWAGGKLRGNCRGKMQGQPEIRATQPSDLISSRQSPPPQLPPPPATPCQCACPPSQSSTPPNPTTHSTHSTRRHPARRAPRVPRRRRRASCPPPSLLTLSAAEAAAAAAPARRHSELCLACCSAPDRATWVLQAPSRPNPYLRSRQALQGLAGPVRQALRIRSARSRA